MCLVFKTTCIDAKNHYGKALFLHEKGTFPPLDKRNTHDKVEGLA